MNRPQRPTPTQIRRRRQVALLLVTLLAASALYLLLAATVFAPVDEHGAKVEQLTVRSAAVDRRLEVEVVVPAEAPARGERTLLVFLHGRGGSGDSFTGNEAIYESLAKLGRRAPIVAFPDGGDHSYWHDRDEGRWGRYVMREAIPKVVRRFGINPRRVAIGGISMGGFGAYNLALQHRGDFARSAATPPPSGSRPAKPRRAPSTTPPTSTATTSSARPATTPTPSAA